MFREYRFVFANLKFTLFSIYRVSLLSKRNSHAILNIPDSLLTKTNFYAV